MATSNFSVTNASGIYVVSDRYTTEDEDGELVEIQRDELDWDMVMESFRYTGNEMGFPYPSDKWNQELSGREVCESDSHTEVYGKKGTAWTTETTMTSVIVLRTGYYQDCNLDFDVKVTDCKGNQYLLSDYSDIGDLFEDYFTNLKEIVEWYGQDHGWNVGTLAMHRNNIEKWFTDHLSAEIEKCEAFCKKICDVQMKVAARFSNGETWYTKVG